MHVWKVFSQQQVTRSHVKHDQGHAGPKMVGWRSLSQSGLTAVSQRAKEPFFPAFCKWLKNWLDFSLVPRMQIFMISITLQYGRSEVGEDMRGQLLEFGGSSLPTCSSRSTYHLFFSPFAQPTGWEVLCQHTFKNAGWSGLGSIALMPRSFVVMAEEEGFWP